LKQALIYSLKNAVNGGLLALIQMYHDPKDYNFRTAVGLRGIAWVFGSAVLAREALIWIPKILQWSRTDGDAKP
jgi:hypothetical protein